MKIYTRKGDKGATSLIGGRRVLKSHIRINAYGTVDELIAFIGVVRDHINNNEIIDQLIQIQDQLMIGASILAADPDAGDVKIPKLSDESIVWLETSIDNMDSKLPTLSNFILPGGHPAVSFCHVARTICRRAERNVLSLSESDDVPDIIIRYLNRLSDYLFVLSRALSVEFKATEIPWLPRLD
jgi:cob(I)alamin adenosyltransferase